MSLKCPPAIVSNYYISNNVLTAEENTTVNIAMKFENSSCLERNTILLTVESLDKQSKQYESRCNYLYINSKCTAQPKKINIRCICGRSEFYMIKRLDRSDNTLWKWTTLWYDNNNDSIVICINVTHPAILVNLTINGHSGRSLLKQNESAYIICKWENSNPPTTARLMKNNQTLAEQNKSENITYILPVVRCSDAGAIKCVTGNEDNLTVLLLVECPPEFVSPLTEIHTLLDEHMFHIEIPVRSHTTQITQCQITRLIESSSTSSSLAKEVNILKPLVIDCSAANDHSKGQCFCLLTGSPPDMIFTMCLLNVTEEYYGVWQAHITNSIGTGQVSSSVHGLKDRSQSRASPDSKGGNVSISLGIIALICAAMAIIISCVKIKLKKGQIIQPSLHDYDEVDSPSTLMVQTCTNANEEPEGRVSNMPSAPFPILNLGSTLPDLDSEEIYSRLQMK